MIVLAQCYSCAFVHLPNQCFTKTMCDPGEVCIVYYFFKIGILYNHYLFYMFELAINHTRTTPSFSNCFIEFLKFLGKNI